MWLALGHFPNINQAAVYYNYTNAELDSVLFMMWSLNLIVALFPNSLPDFIWQQLGHSYEIKSEGCLTSSGGLCAFV